MNISPHLSRNVLLTAVAAGLLVPASSGAAVRWAKPDGATEGPCTTTATACRADIALGVAQSSDEVALLPGTYDVSAHPLEVSKYLNIHGVGNKKPIVTSDNLNAATLEVFQSAGGTTVSGLDIRHTGGSFVVTSNANNATLKNLDIRGPFTGLRVRTGTDQTVEDVTVISTGNDAIPTIMAEVPGTKLRRVNAVVQGDKGVGLTLSGAGSSADEVHILSQGRGAAIAAPEGGPAIPITRSYIASAYLAVSASGGPVNITNSFVRITQKNSVGVLGLPQADLKLRHATVIAEGANTWAVRASNGQPGKRANVDVRNSILRGVAGSISLLPAEPGGEAGTASVAYSNVNAFSAAVKTGQGLQGDDPKFVNPGGADYRVQQGSPVIDAGADDPANGTTDYFGNARKQGAAVDLGAYEATPGQDPGPLPSGSGLPEDPTSGGGAPGGGSGGDGGGNGGGPVGGGADRIAPVLSGVAFTRTTFVASTKSTPVSAGHKRGTALRYKLSEAGTVTVKVQRQVVRKGKRRFVTAGTLTRTSSGGSGTIAFSGRIGKKKLRTGKYRAVVTATDRAGNRSKTRTLGFKIVKR